MTDNWTDLDYEKWAARKQDWGDNKGVDPDPGPESVLQGKIEDHCKEHGYPCLSIRQIVTKYPRIAHLFKDWPDVSIAAPEGRSIWLELKAKHGVLKKGQRDLAMMFIALGHEWYQCKAFTAYLEIMKGRK